MNNGPLPNLPDLSVGCRAKPYGERRLRSLLRDAEKGVAKASEARRRLEPGSSRARITSANARWTTACEHRERLYGAALDEGLHALIDEARAFGERFRSAGV